MEHQKNTLNFNLSPEGLQLIHNEMTRYETKRSCLIPCLWQIQKEKGWISGEAVAWLSEITQLPESQIYEVLTFYTIFNKKPVGKFHIQVCTNLSCSLRGGRDLVRELKKVLNIKKENKQWTLSQVECLGACDKAPVVQINEDYLEKMTSDKILSILTNQG